MHGYYSGTVVAIILLLSPRKWIICCSMTFPQSHGSDSVRDSVAGEQDVDRSAGLRQKVQVHLQRWLRCHGDRVRDHVAKNQVVCCQL